MEPSSVDDQFDRASLPAREAVGLKPGEHVPVAVDTAQSHLFDAETGAPLR